MQASLCLRTAGPNARFQHSPHALCQAVPVLLHRHSQIAQNFSPFFRTGRRARLIQRPFNPAMRAHMTPPEDGIGKKKAEEARRGTVKSVAAAVVLACTLGTMCTNWKASADDHGLLSWLKSPPPTTTDDAPPSTPPSTAGDAPPSTPTEGTTLTKSIQALQAVIDLKCEPGTQKPAPAVPRKLLDLLDKALPPNDQSEWKTYVNQLKKGDKKPDATINSLYKVWKEKTQISAADYNMGLADYNMGLVLIDLLINQGEYERAKDVCQKVESLAPPSDLRAKIRRVVLEMMLLAGKLGSGTLQRKTESTVQKFIKDIKEN